MVRPKTDSERKYEAAEARRKEAEKAVAAAERVTSGHPAKIETKRRTLRNLSNTMLHAEYDQNSRANRPEKKADIEQDIAKLEGELSEARTALSSARDAVQTARAEASQAGAAFTVERDRMLLDNAAAKQETNQARLGIAQQGQELAERKFAQAERDKLEAAKTQLALAQQQGASTMEIERYRAKAKGAELHFEWQQRQEMAAFEAEQRVKEIQATNAGQIDLSRLQGEIAERMAHLSHGQALEIIKANELADIDRAVAHGEIHRKNVTHETDEDIRKAREMLSMAIQKGGADTLNAAKLLLIKHQLRKDEMSHAHKIARQAKAEELDSVSANMAEIAKWKRQPKISQTDFENEPD